MRAFGVGTWPWHADAQRSSSARREQGSQISVTVSAPRLPQGRGPFGFFSFSHHSGRYYL